jgi:hypothetical protein
LYAEVARLKSHSGDSAAAAVANQKAQAVIADIAASVTDETLCATFLNSDAVREVMEAPTENTAAAQ